MAATKKAAAKRTKGKASTSRVARIRQTPRPILRGPKGVMRGPAPKPEKEDDK